MPSAISSPALSRRRVGFEHRHSRLLRECIAEASGVFFYVFPGIASVASFTLNIDSPAGAAAFGSLFQIGLAFGVGITLAIILFVPVSGGHFNPAVTICYAIWRDFPGRKILPFILSQIFGAFFAGMVLMCCYWPEIQAAAALDIEKHGTTVYSP